MLVLPHEVAVLRHRTPVAAPLGRPRGQVALIHLLPGKANALAGAVLA